MAAIGGFAVFCNSAGLVGIQGGSDSGAQRPRRTRGLSELSNGEQHLADSRRDGQSSSAGAFWEHRWSGGGGRNQMVEGLENGGFARKGQHLDMPPPGHRGRLIHQPCEACLQKSMTTLGARLGERDRDGGRGGGLSVWRTQLRHGSVHAIRRRDAEMGRWGRDGTVAVIIRVRCEV